MATVRVMILRAAGTNCDHETEHAWRLAGAEPLRVHIQRLIESPALLNDYQILTIPGGFSYGDDIGAGKVFATQIRRHLFDVLREFVERGRLALGICNGFQVLVKAGLLPDLAGASGAPVCTVTHNEPPGFQDRWVTLRACAGPCVFTDANRTYEMPIAHGEGRIIFRDPATAQRMSDSGQGALQYVPGRPECGRADQPANPNGSERDFAGLCDASGRVFGLMPHPDRFAEWTQHPCWTSLPKREFGDGLAIFQRGVAYFG